jgi:pimeloyl-ACP methyl ester carboxylesterase
MVGGLYLPNQGISDQENASCMYSYSADGTGINILGHSMGSLTLLRALLLTEQPLHVDNFILVSSPSGLDDVYRKKDVAWAVEHGFDGNFAEELLFNLINDHTSDRPGFLGKMKDVWTRAVHNTETGVSPKVYMDQLRIVYETKLMSMIGELAARGIIDNKTRVIYCKSAQDGTVIADQACNNFARFFTDPRLNANFSVTTFNASHANMPAACKKVAPWCRLDPEYYLQ